MIKGMISVWEGHGIYIGHGIHMNGEGKGENLVKVVRNCEWP